MALWMLNWVFLCAVGFVLESMISLLTKEYIPCEQKTFGPDQRSVYVANTVDSLPHHMDYYEYFVFFPAHRADGEVL